MQHIFVIVQKSQTIHLLFLQSTSLVFCKDIPDLMEKFQVTYGAKLLENFHRYVKAKPEGGSLA